MQVIALRESPESSPRPQQVDAPTAVDRLCAAIASQVTRVAHSRQREAYASCCVTLVSRTVLVAGEFGFWPPMGHYEGVTEAVPAIVRDALRDAAADGMGLAAAPGSFEVLVRTRRLPAVAARRHVAGEHDTGVDEAGATCFFGSARSVT